MILDFVSFFLKQVPLLHLLVGLSFLGLGFWIASWSLYGRRRRRKETALQEQHEMTSEVSELFEREAVLRERLSYMWKDRPSEVVSDSYDEDQLSLGFDIAGHLHPEAPDQKPPTAETIDRQKMEIRQLRYQVKTLMSRTRAQYRRAQQETMQMASSIEKRNAEITFLKEEMENLRNLYQDKSEEFEQLVTALDSSKEALKVREEESALVNRVAELDRKAFEESLLEVNQSLAKMRGEKAELIDAKTALKQDMERLRCDFEAKREAERKLRHTVAVEKAQVEAALGHSNALKAEIIALEQELRVRESDLKIEKIEKDDALERMQDQLTIFASKVFQQDDEIGRLREMVPEDEESHGVVGAAQD